MRISTRSINSTELFKNYPSLTSFSKAVWQRFHLLNKAVVLHLPVQSINHPGPLGLNTGRNGQRLWVWDCKASQGYFCEIWFKYESAYNKRSYHFSWDFIISTLVLKTPTSSMSFMNFDYESIFLGNYSRRWNWKMQNNCCQNIVDISGALFTFSKTILKQLESSLLWRWYQRCQQ